MSLEKFASDTSVPIERSQAEARTLLNAHGCTKFALVDEEHRTAIQAVLVKDQQSIMLRFEVTLPDRKDKAITHFVRNRWSYARTPSAADAAHKQECRRRWRCLVLLLKAKFAAVDGGIATFQDEFLANLVLPSGETVGTWAARDLGPAIAEGRMPARLLLGGGS